ncbi:hypothetical protein BGLA2_550015 [Burkholderia gladioli]|nr:hypothetical protein BGLA2_550015 [Burkholderia gladioli]
MICYVMVESPVYHIAVDYPNQPSFHIVNGREVYRHHRDIISRPS